MGAGLALPRPGNGGLCRVHGELLRSFRSVLARATHSLARPPSSRQFWMKAARSAKRFQGLASSSSRSSRSVMAMAQYSSWVILLRVVRRWLIRVILSRYLNSSGMVRVILTMGTKGAGPALAVSSALGLGARAGG